MRSVGQVAVEVMRENGIDSIDMGHYGLLDDIYARCEDEGVGKAGISHPLDRHAYVMSRIRKSKLFYNKGYIYFPGIKVGSRCALMKIVCK